MEPRQTRSRPPSADTKSRSRPPSAEARALQQKATVKMMRPATPERRGLPAQQANVVASSTAAAPAPGCTEDPAASKLRVVCRLRPMSEHEKRLGTVPCVTASTERCEVVVARPQLGSSTRQVCSVYQFDHVLTSCSSQSDVFAGTLKPLVRDVLSGYEAAAFAYGQTGTGKTYTMEGEVDSEEGRGLVPRATAAVIQAVSLGKYLSANITASCLEIYNEELTDLLTQAAVQPKLDLKETGRGIVCYGLSEVSISTVDDVQELIRRAQERRRVAETRVNARSSRSHCLFTLRVCSRQRVPGGEVETSGKLHLVDLAGSECAKKASLDDILPSNPGAVLAGERERRNINQSLLTLGRVIAALRDGSSRVPYRDSKLTRLLQDALGGCCRTVMIATISPAQGAVDETVSTLAYAEQAMGIQNRPVAASVVRIPMRTNSGNAIGDFRNLMAGAAGGDLTGISPTASSMGDCGDMEMKMAYLAQEVEEAQAALTRKHREMEELSTQAEEAEAKSAALAMQLQETQLQCEEREFVCKGMADFADEQSSNIRSLAAALQASRMRALASQQQAQEVSAAAEQRVAALAVDAEDVAARAASAIDEERGLQQQSLHVMQEAAVAQQRVLGGLVAKVRESVRQLSDEVGGAFVKACETAAAEKAADAERLAEIDAAAGSAAAAADKGSTSAREAADRGHAVLTEEVGELDTKLRSCAAALTGAAREALREIEGARTAVAAAHEAATQRLSSTLSTPLASLGDGLRAAATEAEKHNASLIALRGRVVDEGDTANARRQCVQTALREAIEAHAATVASASPALAHALHAVMESLEARRVPIEEGFASATSQLSAARAELAEGCACGTAEVQAVVRTADGALANAWQESGQSLASLKGSLNTEAESLSHAVCALNATREEIAAEVTALRQQRQEEERIVSLLGRQREELQADVAVAQASLAALAREVEESRAALSAAEKNQSRSREDSLQRVMAGMEALLRDELQGLGKQLVDNGAVVRRHMDEVAGHCASTLATLEFAEKHALQTGNEIASAAAGWAAASDMACDNVGKSQSKAREAASGVEAVARRVSSELGPSVGLLETAQEALRPQWSAACREVETAATEWADRDKAAMRALDEVTSHNAATLQAATALWEEAAGRGAVAEKLVAERATQDEFHGAALAALSHLHAESCQADAAANATYCGSLNSLVDGGAAIVESVQQCVPQVDSLLTASAQHADAVSTESSRHGASLGAIGSSVAKLGDQVEASVLDAAQGSLERIRSLGSETAAEVRRCVSQTADAVGLAVSATAAVLDGQRDALTDSAAAAEARWLEFEQRHGEGVKVVEAAAVDAVSSCGTLVEAAETKVHGDKELLAAVCQQLDTAVKDAASQHSSALKEQQCLWKSGLSAAPLSAFATAEHSENIFEDQAGALLIDEEQIKENLLLEVATKERPSEEALAAAFHASRLPASNTILPKKFVQTGGKLGITEETNHSGPRHALRELQI
mmetsp:Transcript_82725/g.151678  ORF Transcript_82725/g.151678 Transcript_82725/m.151678 type:complete len:1494 (-) Transcript_82725:7-4488(-)